ncbi:hypothetical protein, partial [Escherichia coli]|uniref:hypothetical protein n=1 Tax=Escherichia coli TaxID=562 RepID=UPI001F49C651
EWVHVQLHQQKGMISLSPPTICNSALFFLPKSFLNKLVIPTLPFSANTLAELLTFKFCQTCVYPNLTSGLIMKNCQNKIVMSIY